MQIERALRDQTQRSFAECQASRNAADASRDEGQSDQRLRLRRSVARGLCRLSGSFELRFGAVAEPALLECPGLAQTGIDREAVRWRRGGITQAAVPGLRVRIVVRESGERGET